MSKLYTTVNNTIVSINNCEDEPIKIPGSIQPHGFVFIINKNTGIISFCSSNTSAFLGQPPGYFLAQPYHTILPEQLYNIIGELPVADTEYLNPRMPVPIEITGVSLDCFKRVSGDYVILECINSVKNHLGTYDLFLETSDLLTSTDTKETLYDLCVMVVQNIRRLTGFDRVMVYKFDSDYNGHVFAESISENIDSFLGLHFPNTDIPKQARELYLKNPFRLIPAVGYEPIPIVTHDPELARPELIDLSDVQIRSVSPIHITYLKNMGVGASMSISIIKGAKLWGLITCHHLGTKHLIYIRQFQAYMLAQILSSQIAAYESKELYTLARQLDVPLRELMRYLQRHENFIELHFEKLEAVKKLVNASGAALIYNNKVYSNGVVPDRAFILSLKNWLDEMGAEDYSTAELCKDFPEANDFTDKAAGLLYRKLDSDSKTALFWFRQSSTNTIAWAGNPEAGKETSPLSPRNSFAAWKQILKGTSAPWNQPELDAAFRFAYLLQQHMLNLLKLESEVRNRRLNEQLLKANKELENINWISTHDLKEPLRKIQVFASMIDNTRNVPTVDAMNRSIERIKLAAVKMQQFIDDLFLYSQMSGTEMKYESVDLSEVIWTALEDFADEKEKGLFRLECSVLPVINASRFQMQQLFVNLIDNSIKFRKLNQTQVININYEEITDPDISGDEKVSWHKIIISDTGIGFSKAMSNTVFDLFKRGNSGSSYKGTGVGLSVCKRIMENHGGQIKATGVEGEGAVFALYFPISQD